LYKVLPWRRFENELFRKGLDDNKSMKKLIKSFGYAFKGVAYATKTQLNFRIHLAATVIAVLMGLLLHISAGDWQWIALSITLVLVTEIFNTMIETLTDLVSPGYNEKAGHIKDMSAGAVVIAAIFALVTGIIIFLPRLLLLIK
jgi:diacylglycerol kinase (ATP)